MQNARADGTPYQCGEYRHQDKESRYCVDQTLHKLWTFDNPTTEE
jgi:hypothetical protein